MERIGQHIQDFDTNVVNIVFLCVLFTLTLQYYEMSYGLNIEMHKQVSLHISLFKNLFCFVMCFVM